MPSRLAAAVLCLPLLAACEVTTVDGTRPPNAAERSCLSALAAKDVRRSEMTIVHSTSVPEGDIVMIRVTGAEKPWRCIAGLDGTAQTLENLNGPAA